jgi:hypothetical protein
MIAVLLSTKAKEVSKHRVKAVKNVIGAFLDS